MKNLNFEKKEVAASGLIDNLFSSIPNPIAGKVGALVKFVPQITKEGELVFRTANRSSDNADLQFIEGIIFDDKGGQPMSLIASNANVENVIAGMKQNGYLQCKIAEIVSKGRTYKTLQAPEGNYQSKEELEALGFGNLLDGEKASIEAA